MSTLTAEDELTPEEEGEALPPDPAAEQAASGYVADYVSGRRVRATPEEVDRGLDGDGAELLTAPTGHFTVGRYAGEPAACGGFLMLDEKRAELTRVYVRPGYRGRGGGRLLLTVLEDRARVLGATEMVLNTRLDLIEARSLYRREGYVEIPAYCRGPYMEVWYGKSLACQP
jgi:GNAT superfamily N-acetyltransferase